MACFSNCRYTRNGPYYPCQVTTSFCNCTGNSVINPVSTESFAFLSLVSPATVDCEEIVPVALSSSGGSGITSTESGVVNLTPGTYQATFNVTSEIGASGENNFALSVNDEVLSSSISQVQGTIGNVESVSNSVVITISESSTLNLINNGTDEVTISNANLFVRRIS